MPAQTKTNDESLPVHETVIDRLVFKNGVLLGNHFFGLCAVDWLP